MASESDNLLQFANLSVKISQLLYSKGQNARPAISGTLDDLNAINYKYPVVTNHTKAVLLVNHCCCLIDPQDTDLFLKTCRLITNLVVKQKIVVEGRTLQISVQWCLKGLPGQGGADRVTALTSLDALLRSSDNQLLVEIVQSPQLLEFASKKQDPLEVTLGALQILEAATFPASSTENCAPALGTCYDIFLGHLLKTSRVQEQVVAVRILVTCLRGLQNILTRQPDLCHENLGIILGIVRSFMLFGLADVEYMQPRKLLPAAMSIPEPASGVNRVKKGGKLTKQRKPKSQNLSKSKKQKQPLEPSWVADNFTTYTPANLDANLNVQGDLGNRLKTSDSDVSDSESAKFKSVTGRVRQGALALFHLVVKITEKAVMFSYWSSFIPESLVSGKHHLLTCVLRETTTRGRIAALNVLLALLTSSKFFLLQAEKGDNLSFTPFSVVIGLMLREIHRCLCLALNKQSVLVLVQILKCCSALVQATPYQKLGPGLVSKLVRNIKRFVDHKDPTVQVAALIVLGCTLASEPVIQETRNAFLSQELQTPSVRKHVKPDESSELEDNDVNNFDYAEFSCDSEEDDDLSNKLATLSTEAQPSWLLFKCLKNLQPSAPSSVKMESLQVISTMSRNYFEVLLAPHLAPLIPLLNASLADKSNDVRLQCCQAVDFIGQAMTASLTNDNHGPITVEQCVIFWQSLLDQGLTHLISGDCQIVKAAACDCLGSIGDCVFEHLPRDKQILCVTILFGCSRDTEPVTKGAAIRALAIFVLYPSLRDDSGFVVDTADAIYRTIKEGNPSVRVKLSWALGNLSDALVLNKSSIGDELPDSLLLKLLKLTNEISSEGEKIRMNTVRALGNFLQTMTKNHTENQQLAILIKDAFKILVKNCTTGSNMKVRWNACYALGNAMKNTELYITDTAWTGDVFTALTSLVENFTNFKVRVFAAMALASPQSRDFYGQYYQLVWKSLANALETAQQLEDFNEYKHRDNLIEQICLSMAHLTLLINDEDLSNLHQVFTLEIIKIHMKRVWERLLPEKSTVLFDAYSFLSGKGKNHLTDLQRTSLSALQEIFKQDF